MNDFEKELNLYLPISQEKGAKIEGTLIRKDNEFGYLNTNNKLEARIKLNEIENLEIGETISVLIYSVTDEFILVSKNALEREEELKSLTKGSIVKGKILERGKIGYLVKLNSLTATLPYRQSVFNKDYDIISKEFDFEVTEKKGKIVILSRLNIVKNEIDTFFKNTKIGDVVTGSIHNILDYGLIINLGPIKALLHQSELSWDKETKLKQFKQGDKISAKIIELCQEENKVKLSLKQLTPNPWFDRKNKYQLGQNFDAPIKQILDFGVVVDLGEDEGFIHISDLFYKKVNNIEKEYQIGNVIPCEIIGFNDEKERISLSSKVVFYKIWDEIDNFHFINDIVKVQVTRVKDFGLFAKSDENIEIFVPKSEFSWKKNEIKKYNINDTIDVKIIEINKEEKNIVASIRKLGVSPFEVASNEYALNEEYNVIVTDKIENGVLVKLTDDFKGLIPKNELLEDVNIGETVLAIVFEKNEKKNSILLSVKKIEEIKEEKEMEELKKQYVINN